MSDIDEEKRALRVRAAEKRRVAHGADADGRSGVAVRDHALAGLPVAKAAVIGGYWPIGTEMNVHPLLVALHERGHVIGLPHAHRGQPMTYHRWQPNDRLAPGIFGIAMPDRRTPEVAPDILLMPLLAFDRQGNRLGYGSGYNDRTIPVLRARKALLCVGIAYAAQEFDYVPHNALDQRLDWMVTERGVRRAERRRFLWLRRFFDS
ncbi:MAG TPA: 5-formyltetrahydrofolate cyclo-ligase [Stellaceae bacterium]|jgi:5-formyltetrahydrofolate cyclo-ligase|nr:5-formyltetrahydrofolate cyclo-ligase [Stellaceae bacterium]